MMLRGRFALGVAVALFVTSTAKGQTIGGRAGLRALAQHYGGGISSDGLGGGVDGQFVRENWGPPDSVRLVAVVLFRGQPMAGVTRTGTESRLTRAMMDSLSHEAASRGAWAGGSVTPWADQWIEFSPKSRTLRTQGREWRATAHDSVLVVFVDQTERGGDKPTTSSCSIFSPAELDAARPPDGDLMAQSRNWANRLLADPTIQRFVRGDPLKP